MTARALGERRQLAMTNALRRSLDAYLSLDEAVSAEAAYERVFEWKGVILARQKRLRLERSRPDLAPLFAELERVTSRLATLVLQTAAPDTEALAERAEASASTEQERLEGSLAERGAAFLKPEPRTALPGRHTLGSSLPADAAFVDFLEYTAKKRDDKVPGRLVEEPRAGRVCDPEQPACAASNLVQ